MQRRAFTSRGLRWLLMAQLLRIGVRADALEGSLKWSVRPWLQKLQDASAALASGTVAPRAWQDAAEQVLGGLDLGDFLRSIDFDRLAAGARLPQQGESMQRLYFPDDAGRLQPLAFRPCLFALKQGNAVVPHGHHNLATLHLMLEGRARVRHYDRVETTSTHLLIRPASDAVVGPGQVSSVSDDHHNIHWFEALSPRVLMFNIGVYQLAPGRPFGERDYVDAAGGATVGDGLRLAPRLDRATAYAKYGRA
jgi:hypothetical protein